MQIDTDLLQDIYTDLISGLLSGCKLFLNFAPQLPDLTVTSPDTSPDVSVFPFSIDMISILMLKFAFSNWRGGTSY